jgi:Helix-turn-helix domain
MRAIRDSELPTLTKAVACASIGLRAGSDGSCWPSYQQIAGDIGSNRRTAIRHVAALVRGGWLMVASRSNGHGSQSNSYFLSTPVPNLWITKGGSDAPVTPLVTPPSPASDSPVTPQGVTPQSPRSRSPKEVRNPPTLEPVENRHLKAVINGLADQHRIPK